MTLNLIDIVRGILANERAGLHVDEIASRVAASGMSVERDQEILKRRLMTLLAAKVKEKDPLFRKIKNGAGGFKKGIYSLRVEKRTAAKVNGKLFLDDEPQLSTVASGKAGEYAVFSELLFRGFNVSIMTIDDGIDLIASKANKFFHIQVKTTRVENYFGFQISRSSFETYKSGHTYYVFVIRRVLANRRINDFVVLPCQYLTQLITRSLIPGEANYSIRITIDEAGSFFLNKTQDVTSHVNNFGQIL